MSRVAGEPAGVLCVGEDWVSVGFALHMQASPLGRGLLHLQYYKGDGESQTFLICCLGTETPCATRSLPATEHQTNSCRLDFPRVPLCSFSLLTSKWRHKAFSPPDRLWFLFALAITCTSLRLLSAANQMFNQFFFSFNHHL